MQCVLDGAHLSMNRSTDSQLIRTFMRSWSYTGTKMFSQWWRGKKTTCFCSDAKYLNIISVLYRQTHNVVYCIKCFISLGKQSVRGDLGGKKHLMLWRMKRWLLLDFVKLTYCPLPNLDGAASNQSGQCLSPLHRCSHIQMQKLNIHYLDLVNDSVLSSHCDAACAQAIILYYYFRFILKGRFTDSLATCD